MTEDANPDYKGFNSEFIRFDTPGLLGAGTNGAPPDTAFGFIVEAEMTHVDGGVSECYWLRPVTEIDVAGKARGTQNFLFTGDRMAYGRLLSTMYDNLSRGAGVAATAVDGAFDGRRNWAQEDFDPEMGQDDDIEGVKAFVGRSPAGHLEVSLLTGNGKAGFQAVARLDGHLTNETERFRSVMTRVMAWARDSREALDERALEHAAPMSPGP